MVDPLGVAYQISRVEVDRAQVAGAVVHGFDVEVGRIGMTALAGGGGGAGLDFVAEFDDRAPYVFSAGIGLCTEGGERPQSDEVNGTSGRRRAVPRRPGSDGEDVLYA